MENLHLHLILSREKHLWSPSFTFLCSIFFILNLQEKNAFSVETLENPRFVDFLHHLFLLLVEVFSNVDLQK